MQNKTAEEKFNALRRQAEELMSNPDFPRRWVAVEDPLRLIHELQTFQVELELQNDELRRAQQELMEFKINYTQLYDFTPVGYVTLDSKGKILNANLTLARMLATERSALINRPLSDHILPEDQDIYYLHLKALFESKKRQICDLEMKKKQGPIFDVQLESTVIPEPGQENARYRTVIIDVSKQKQAEKKQKEIKLTLEEKVKERTAELEDMNATLRILLKKREEDKNEIGENIFANHKLILAPIIQNLKKSLTRESQKDMMDILESELKNILSPFSKKLSDHMVNLTPMEIHVADLVKFGKTNKEISEITHSSIHTISRHRENIRKKTGLKNKKINLRSFLLTLE